MRSLLTLLFAIVLLSLSATQVQTKNIVSSSTARITDETEFARSRKFLDNEKHIKRVQIRNQAGLDGKVQRIRLSRDFEENKPGIHAYGLPKKRLPNNGVIERVYVEGGHIDDVSRSSRLVEAYGMPKDDINTNGFIERLSSPSADDRQSEKLDSQNENVRVRRSIREGSDNKIEDKISSEAEDMVAQDAKVFRPLFVYRQQVAARERRNHARNVVHRNHRHAAHQPCYHRQY